MGLALWYKTFRSMKTFLLLLLFSALTCMTESLNAQDGKNTDKPDARKSSDSLYAALRKPQKVITHGTVTIEGKALDYDAVAGTLVLKNKKDQPTCSMFYAAYFRSGEKDTGSRPITFIYNGGPGSSSIWLHMGAWGPRRVGAEDTARLLPPYKTVNNEYSLLDASDLVFIDAPGTGFSRIIEKDMGGEGKPEDFYGSDEDAEAFTLFITQFLTVVQPLEFSQIPVRRKLWHLSFRRGVIPPGGTKRCRSQWHHPFVTVAELG